MADQESNDVLRTRRLLLRRWRPEDRTPFARLNADPRVMEFMPSTLSRERSDAFAARIEAHFDTHGFGPWAVEVPGIADFIGYVGLAIVDIETHFTPCVEIEWRLDADVWGHGYATEAAQAALAYGREVLHLKNIVSFTVPDNRRSRGVMERIGLVRDPADDFDHPQLPVGHSLRRHVLYRLPS